MMRQQQASGSLAFSISWVRMPRYLSCSRLFAYSDTYLRYTISTRILAS